MRIPNDQIEDRTGNMINALRLQSKETVTLIGAGGKTKFMLRLAGELVSQEMAVVITTTTRLGFSEADEANCFVVEDNLDKALQRLSSGCTPGRTVVVGRAIDVDGKLVGVPADWVDSISRLPQVSHTIVEADWACGRSIIVNGLTEPRIPASSSKVVSLAGVDVVGKPLNIESVCRPDALTELTGCRLGEEITPDVMARSILHYCRRLSTLPENCCLYPVLNKVEGDEAESKARLVGKHLLDMGLNRVILASCQSEKPIVDVLDPVVVN